MNVFSRRKKQHTSIKMNEVKLINKYLSQLFGLLLISFTYATVKLADDLDGFFGDYSGFIIVISWLLFFFFVWGSLMKVTEKLNNIDNKLHWYESEMERIKIEEKG